jgi:hypothetical protein
MDAAARFDIPAFLAQHPSFTFDIEEFLCSYRVADVLRHRMRQFAESLHAPAGDWPARGDFMTFLRTRHSGSVLTPNEPGVR